jgi:hypothetical protein
MLYCSSGETLTFEAVSENAVYGSQHITRIENILTGEQEAIYNKNFTPTFARGGVTAVRLESSNVSQEILFQVAPQPAREQATLMVGDIEGVLTITIIDSRGMEVASLEREQVQYGRIDLPIENLASGYYSVRVESKSGMHMVPLVITK